MVIEALISTMFIQDLDGGIQLYKKMNVETNAVMINQCNKNSMEVVEIDGKRLKFVCTQTRGLSISRNLAVLNSDAEICVIADDDIRYVTGYSKIIEEAYMRNKEADVICFQSNHGDIINNIFTTALPYKKKKIGMMSAGGIISNRISFKKKSLSDKNIQFDVLFGSGSKHYNAGEETILIRDCIRKGLSIIQIPYVLVNILQLEKGSTWFEGFNEAFFISRGAIYARGVGRYRCLPYIMRFLIKRTPLGIKRKAFNWMLKGRINWIKMNKVQNKI